MTDVTSPPASLGGSNSAADPLAELANRIKSYHKAVEDAAKNIVEKAILAGQALNEAKGKVLHGEWLPWLQKECGLPERTAQRYMRLATGKKKIDQWLLTKSATMADLTLAQVERIVGDDYEKAVASLIKRLKGLPPNEMEHAAQVAIAALQAATNKKSA